MKEDVKDFLLKNGFQKIKETEYKNEHCTVIINDKENIYEIIDNDIGVMYSSNLNIYWLIGNLTYRGFLTKNYKRLDEDIEISEKALAWFKTRKSYLANADANTCMVHMDMALKIDFETLFLKDNRIKLVDFEIKNFNKPELQTDKEKYIKEIEEIRGDILLREEIIKWLKTLDRYSLIQDEVKKLK